MKLVSFFPINAQHQLFCFDLISKLFIAATQTSNWNNKCKFQNLDLYGCSSSRWWGPNPSNQPVKVSRICSEKKHSCKNFLAFHQLSFKFFQVLLLEKVGLITLQKKEVYAWWNKTTWVFVFQIYDQFWSISLELFIKHKPLFFWRVKAYIRWRNISPLKKMIFVSSFTESGDRKSLENGPKGRIFLPPGDIIARLNNNNNISSSLISGFYETLWLFRLLLIFVDF